MNHPTWLFIQGCWIAWLVYWVVTAFSTKRTVERGGWIGYRLVAVLGILVLLAAGRLLGVSSRSQLWHTTLALGVVSACLVVAGLAFCVWARIALGRNWSAEVTVKQDHELIETGPYSIVRHPIYTGLIVAALGTVINYGRAIGLVGLFAVCCGLWWKARQEERIMEKQFPGDYPEYRRRVHAIIPFVL